MPNRALFMQPRIGYFLRRIGDASLVARRGGPVNSSTTPVNPDTRFWDRTARAYAKSPVEDPEGYERSLARVATLLCPEDEVLELGCGTGSTALRLAPRARRYLATDISPEMVAIANEKLVAAPQANLRFAVATAEELSAPGPGFDAVLGFNYLHLVPDLSATLACVYRLLRPGGLFVSKSACVAELNLVIRTSLPILRLIGKAPATVAVFGEVTLLAAIQGAGFQVHAVERHGTKGKGIRAFVVARRPEG